MSMRQKKYLVTGGTGFIGSALVRRLVNQGHHVRILDNNLRGVPGRLADVSDKIEMIEGDITHPNVVSEACEDRDSVCHLAYLNGTKFFYEMPELVLDIGVKGMVNVIDGCRQRGVKELVLASSSEVYQTAPTIPTDETAPLCVPDPLNPRFSYGGGKIISELMVINYGRKYFDRVLIFRPHNVYGPDMGWEHVIPEIALRMKQVVDDTPDGPISFPIQGDGKETRSFIFIDDFIDGLQIVLEKGEHLNIYHIGTMEELSIRTLVEEMAGTFKREIRIVPGERRAGSTLRRCPDIAKLRRLGFQPKVSISEGLQRTMQWYIQNRERKPV